jgi:hypothetical protein
MLGPGDVERGVGERQVEGVGLPVLDPAREARPGRELGRDGTIGLGQVDADDVAAIGGGQMARRAAQARADVEDPAGGRGPQPCRQLFRRLPAADVELVDGREIGRRQMVEIRPGRA